jgi:fumarylacetoacetase
VTDGFGLDNLPYGAVARPGEPARLAVRYGDDAVFLDGYDAATGLPPGTLAGPVLNPLLALGRPAWSALRACLRETIEAGRHDPVPLAGLEPRLPVAIGDYVDFYSSLEHASNLGRMFRPDAEPLLPNWRHLPVGYHGRASSVVVSGTPIRRPRGQLPPAEPGGWPGFGPSRRLDIELELGFITGPGNELGTSIPTSAAADHVFGFVLVNDWSARDIQRWEYVPLGPFLGKSFATSISPWVVPLEVPRPRPAAGPRAARVPAHRGRLGARHRARGRAQRARDLPHERARPVLDVPATTRPRDRQRHQRAPRRPLRVGHDLRRRAGQPGQPHRAHREQPVPGGRRHRDPARQRRRSRVLR